MNNIEELINNKGTLDIVHPDVATMLQEDHTGFTMVRRSGLGASDSSVYLGVNKWKSTEDLIREKTSIGLTAEELEVAGKEVVRKGADLEPIILGYFEKNMGLTTCKPKAMYRSIADPQLTINFDGVTEMNGVLIPVEAKFCSMYANKYWDRGKTIDNIAGGSEYVIAEPNITEHITEVSKLYGIPPYYYTQIQQQIYGLDAPFAFLQVLFDKGWEPATYKIHRNSYVIACLREESKKVWDKIKSKTEIQTL